MVAVAEVIATISASIGLVKELNAVDRELDLATYKLSIADLTSKLADAQIGLTEIRAEISEKDEKIAELQKALMTKAELVEHRGALYKSVNGSPIGAQICPLCVQKYGLTVETRSDGRTDVCPNCKSVFERRTRMRYPEDSQE